jgi:SAM-dependent methyltransferase
MIEPGQERDGLAWQTGVWNRVSEIYLREIEQRFAPVVDAVIARAAIAAGESVLDLGTGTGAVARRAAAIVGPSGCVTGVDISPDMLALAQQRASALGFSNVRLLEGRAESIPADDGAFDVVLASLSLMYVINREAAASEIARVLRPGGRLLAAVWGDSAQCDIVLLQETAGRFADPAPVPGVGPGALAEPSTFLRNLAAAGIETTLETETLSFEFPDFASAWNALAGITTAHLSPEHQHRAKSAVMTAMYPHGDGPRLFQNLTKFIVGRARR